MERRDCEHIWFFAPPTTRNQSVAIRFWPILIILSQSPQRNPGHGEDPRISALRAFIQATTTGATARPAIYTLNCRGYIAFLSSLGATQRGRYGHTSSDHRQRQATSCSSDSRYPAALCSTQRA